MSDTRRAVQFTAPVERAGWALRGTVASGVVLVLARIAAGGGGFGRTAGGWIAAAGIALFLLLAAVAWVRACSPHPPLVIDEYGLAVADGLRGRWRVTWREIARVELDDGVINRRVVLELRGAAARRVIPACCHGGLPAEWLAGAIEAMRARGTTGADPAETA
jgi:hypothetical protein